VIAAGIVKLTAVVQLQVFVGAVIVTAPL
jgi:hypothetical protein